MRLRSGRVGEGGRMIAEVRVIRHLALHRTSWWKMKKFGQHRSSASTSHKPRGWSLCFPVCVQAVPPLDPPLGLCQTPHFRRACAPSHMGILLPFLGHIPGTGPATGWALEGEWGVRIQGSRDTGLLADQSCAADGKGGEGRCWGQASPQPLAWPENVSHGPEQGKAWLQRWRWGDW